MIVTLGVFYFSFCLSLAVLIFFSFLALKVKKNKNLDQRIFTPLLFFTIGVFFSLFVASIPISLAEGYGVVPAIFVSILTTLQAIFVNRDFSSVHLVLADLHGWLAGVGIVYVAILHVLAPLLVIGIVLSLVKDFVSSIKSISLKTRDIYVFSDLNERSVSLAEDIALAYRKHGGRNLFLVFTDVVSDNPYEACNLIDRTKEIGAVLLRKDIARVSFRRYNQLNIFIISPDPDLNLEKAINILGSYKEDSKAAIFMVSEKKEAEILLDPLDKGKARLTIINESKTMVYDLLDRRPLFLNAVNRKISVLIVGAGRIGFEALKGICWCGQIDGYELEIYVLDRYADRMKGRLDFECPEIFNKSNNNPSIKREEQEYQIHFIQADVASVEFIDFLHKIGEITYVLVALGDDELNIKISVMLRSILQRKIIKDMDDSRDFFEPAINTVVESQLKLEIVNSLVARGNNPYKISAFGSIKDNYKYAKLIHSYLEALALNVHLVYSECLGSHTGDEMYLKAKERFYQSEYNKRSSFATALHIKYKLFGALTAGDIHWTEPPDESLIKEFEEHLKNEGFLSRLMEVEHRRWNAYIRTEGYVCASEEDYHKYYPSTGDHRNELAKLHPCLVPFDELDRVSRFVNDRQNTQNTKKDFKREDKKIIEAIPEILRKARDQIGNGIIRN